MDNVLEILQSACVAMRTEQKAGKPSRESSIALTHLETAILWRQRSGEVAALTDGKARCPKCGNLLSEADVENAFAKRWAQSWCIACFEKTNP